MSIVIEDVPAAKRPKILKSVARTEKDAIIPDRKAALLKRISDAECEIGRLAKLLGEMRADALHLTVE